MKYYLETWQAQHGKGGDIPTYSPDNFEQMLEENQVDTVIVTTVSDQPWTPRITHVLFGAASLGTTT